MVDSEFWKGKKVFITGHTGFKGSWLCLWLHSLGAEVTGYALEPPTTPSLFKLCEIDKLIDSVTGDIRDRDSLYKAISDAKPEIIIHMAAQPIVRTSYHQPIETFDVNVMGTVNLLDVVRQLNTSADNIKVILNVTTDKCYENKEWEWGYREIDSLGGYDPYSSSKACSELVTQAFRSSYFNPKSYTNHGVAVATARAGNVIGGGDFAKDRLLPDCIRSILSGDEIVIRNPKSIRPWQHVLEPLSGYLTLAQRLYLDGSNYAESWNFGPQENDAKSVEHIVMSICDMWGNDVSYRIESSTTEHEATYLKLDWSKAKQRINWTPRWNLDKAIEKSIDWVKAYQSNKNMTSVCIEQIHEYSNM
ncbi:CDP-glucose 4,6-dehydratase [Ornithinibacillus californiensis]|uniref:CDP-glucose 4,6-dehydratase n=1 Tax=Ornithinibacillus californiensis TaxID=161536 RepID=UPI00064DFF89|nr:CDP-glucose 4,6-dehydratase [Ornithinibacillus californiensis]